MHQKLVELAFDKTGEKLKTEFGIIASFTKKSEHLELILKEEFDTKYSDKSLREVHNGNTIIKKQEVLKALCNFLEYDSYEDFLRANSENKTDIDTSLKADKNDLLNTFLKYKKILIGVLSGVILFLCISTFTVKKQRWMIWKVDHYEEVSFDPQKYGIGKLKLYKEERILYFKKIEGTCEYAYFDTEGEVTIWYGKNHKGKLELFTSLGLHPETGKTLKPITRYMIRKYICPEY